MMAGPSVHYCWVVSFLVLIVLTTVQSSSSRSLPTYTESSFNGGQFSTGGIQLLIPTLNFTFQGTATEWSAHVTGDTSISDLIEFQIFKPDDVNDDLYHLIYGNPYDGNNAQDSVITQLVQDGGDLLIPIKEGYIIGVYLPPSVAGVLDLLYDNNGDTDIYYWENIDSRTCDYSLCSGKVKRNVNLLIGWNFVSSSLSVIQSTLDAQLTGNPSYCQGSISQCINDSIVVTSTTTLSSNPLSSSPISSSFSIDDSMVSISLSTTTHVISTMSTTVGPSSTSNGSPLAPEQITGIGVILVLFVIILVLIIAIGVCCCLKRKPVIESSNIMEKVNDQCINEKEIEMFSNTLYNSVGANDDQSGIHSDVPFQSNPAYNAEIRSTNYINGRSYNKDITDGELIYSEVGNNSLHISSSNGNKQSSISRLDDHDYY